MLPQAADSRTRPRIGRYLITGRIGRGGMGMVYRGLDEALEREVAVKTLTVEGTADGESRKRFEREARAAAHLQHPNIVTVYELGEDRGLPYIAMELLPGTDLDALLRSGEEIPLAEKLDVVAQVCRGLAFAHERGIVHRDIKPSNVRLLDDGTAKIMDFGIAKYGDAHLTKTGMMLGTVQYMSPEQVRGKPLDGRSDVFSVGVILYELLAGQRPFRGEGATQVLYKIVHEEPPPVDLGALGELAPQLQAILALSLAKEPDARYPGAAALGAALAGVLEEVRKAETPLPPIAVAALGAARKAAPGAHTDESLARLQGLVITYPGFLDARRALRTAMREQRAKRASGPAAPEAYPELEATFRPPPTRHEPATELQPTATVTVSGGPTPGAPAPGASEAASRRAWIGVVSALLVVCAIAALLLLRGIRPSAPAEAHLGVRSQPMGASVLLDGRETGVVTNGELVVPSPVPGHVVLTFRMNGHRDETRTVRLPLPPGEAVSVTLQSAARLVPVRTQPPGAAVTVDGSRMAGVTPLEVSLDPASEHRVAVSLDGHVAQEVRIEKDASPAAIDVVLEKQVPAGTVAVASAYPLDVLWRGRALVRGETSPRVPVPGGRQVLTLVSSSVFLKADVVVQVPPGGEVPLQAPLAGKLNVRAVPDNCEVFVDGAFVDYPPILERLVAAGRHTVSFRWPDGTRKEQVLEVKGAASNFVSERKDQP
jgi:eukaryotic-like serine/threonine-protein kinase